MRFAILGLALLPMTASAQTTAHDIVLGNQLAQEVERQTTPVTDAVVIAYVHRIARKIAQAAELPTPLTVRVINADTSYAYPGTLLYVDTSLILNATSEAELAGAIAHLIGHLAQWRTDTAAIAGQIPLVMGVGGCLREGPGLAAPMRLFEQQATLEAKADEIGLGYMVKSGYDPAALADFYQRMLATSRTSPLQAWRVFPGTSRVQADQLRAKGNNWVITTSEFRNVQQRLMTLQEEMPRRTPSPTLYSGK